MREVYPIFDRMLNVLLTLIISTTTIDGAFLSKITKTNFWYKMENDFLTDIVCIVKEVTKNSMIEKYAEYRFVRRLEEVFVFILHIDCPIYFFYIMHLNLKNINIVHVMDRGVYVHWAWPPKDKILVSTLTNGI